MPRLIDADALKESIQYSGTDEKKMMSTKELYKSLISWIDDRPTIELKKRKMGEWIPCNWHKDTENLPDEGKSVLICIKDKIGMYVDVSYRTDYNRWERYGRNVNVVAWCELPEPWRGEEHDE